RTAKACSRLSLSGRPPTPSDQAQLLMSIGSFEPPPVNVVALNDGPSPTRLSVVHATAFAGEPVVTDVVPQPATPPPVTSLQTLSQSSNAAGVPIVFVNDDASPSSWNRPVSCTARTITTPAPTANARDSRIPQRLRQLPVGPTTCLAMPI